MEDAGFEVIDMWTQQLIVKWDVTINWGTLFAGFTVSLQNFMFFCSIVLLQPKATQ
jgi:hypothetical protein